MSLLLLVAFAGPIIYGAALLDRYEERLMRREVPENPDNGEKS